MDLDAFLYVVPKGVLDKVCASIFDQKNMEAVTKKEEDRGLTEDFRIYLKKPITLAKF